MIRQGLSEYKIGNMKLGVYFRVWNLIGMIDFVLDILLLGICNAKIWIWGSQYHVVEFCDVIVK